MKKNKTLALAYLAVILALTVVMAFTPYVGFIPIAGGVGITLLLIPTAVAAIVIGKYYGLAASSFFGIVSFVYAWTMPISPLEILFRYPHVSILARIPIGFVMALAYKYSKRLFRGREIPAYITGAIAGAVTNTVLVFTMMWLTLAIAPNLVPEFEMARGAFLALIGVIFTVNFPIEIAALAIVAPPIIYALKKTPQFRNSAECIVQGTELDDNAQCTIHNVQLTDELRGETAEVDLQIDPPDEPKTGN